jgi:RNA polymerase sigma factor (TIGR02999 family)
MPDATDDEQALAAMLIAAERGEMPATTALFEALYAELHRLAQRQLRASSGQLTLGATTLLHEAYLRLSQRSDLAFPDSARFFAYAARAMRGLIVDYVRERRALKRGGAFHLTSGDTEAEGVAQIEDLGPLSDALDALAVAEPSLAELVELKFFCGFGFAEIAAMRGVTERTVQRHWDKARLFLRYAIDER